MKIKKSKQMLATLVLTTMLLIVNPGFSKATLQANPNTQYTKTGDVTYWMTEIRNMEKTGGAMELSETLNSDLTASSESNNIDVHMMKSTEYGAIAILAVSGYGNPEKVQDSSVKTTTGNKTGAYFLGGWEAVAGGISGCIFPNVNSIYYDSYTTDYNPLAGDALGSSESTNPGCKGWHSSGNARWPDSRYPYLFRSCSTLFNFDVIGWVGYTPYARGVAVCGTGL